MPHEREGQEAPLASCPSHRPFLASLQHSAFVAHGKRAYARSAAFA